MMGAATQPCEDLDVPELPRLRPDLTTFLGLDA